MKGWLGRKYNYIVGTHMFTLVRIPVAIVMTIDTVIFFVSVFPRQAVYE